MSVSPAKKPMIVFTVLNGNENDIKRIGEAFSKCELTEDYGVIVTPKPYPFTSIEQMVAALEDVLKQLKNIIGTS